MKARIPDLTVERLDADLVRLEQAYGMDEPVVVDLHRIHVAHLAGMFGLAGTQEQERTIEQLGDALVDLRNGICRLANLLASVPTCPPGRETEDVMMAWGLVEHADGILDRFRLAEPMPKPSDAGSDAPRNAATSTDSEPQQLELTA